MHTIISGIISHFSLLSMLVTFGILPASLADSPAVSVHTQTAKSHPFPGDQQLSQTSPPKTGALTDAEAAHFLMQATLGFNRQELSQARSSGFHKWISDQIMTPATHTEPYIEYLTSFGNRDYSTSARTLPYHKVLSDGNTVGYLNFSTAWLRSVLGGHDLLRQKVAWSLSQILVVSNKTNLLTEASANYYDLLLNRAFDKYEDLLLDVTLHPVMGNYLTYIGNTKPNPAKNQVPDENFAREVMQLFSIGLWQLEQNGEVKKNVDHNPIPTYNNEDIRELSKVFTGLWLADAPFGRIDWSKYDQQMVMNHKLHDQSAKNILDGYIDIPSKTPPMEEIKLVIKKLALHPNTAPFISKRLIQNLVTSNPSSGYIGRVVEVWLKSDGNLGKVVTAILLDEEAKFTNPHNVQRQKLKEPIVRVVNIMKAFSCGTKLGKAPTDYPGLQWWHPFLESEIKQEPLGAPSVFNFFDSTYSAPGEISQKTLVSPEFQLMDAVTTAKFTNYLWEGLTLGFHRHPYGMKSEPFSCDFTNESELLKQETNKLVEHVSLMLTANTLSKHRKDIINRILIPIQSPIEKIVTTILGVAVSPEGAILK